MQHVLTTEQLMQIHGALIAPTHETGAINAYQSRPCAACEGDGLRRQAATLIEDILNANGAKGEPDATRSDD